MVAAFLARRAARRPRAAGPDGLPRPPGLLERAVGWQLLPGGDAGTDGFYYACLQQTADLGNQSTRCIRAARTISSDAAVRGAAGAGSAATASRADALDGVLEVRSAYVSARPGRVPAVRARRLPGQRRHPCGAQGWPDAHLRPRRGGVARTALLDGRNRRAKYTLKRELNYHAVSDRYVTRDVDPPNSTEQHSYATLEEALEALGTRGRLAVPAVSTQLSASRQYRVSLRAGVRRGRLPDTLRVLLFWTDDWHRESEWFSWSLQR